jgi:hypothetical protein
MHLSVPHGTFVLESLPKGSGGLSVVFTQGKDVSGYWLPFA